MIDQMLAKQGFVRNGAAKRRTTGLTRGAGPVRLIALILGLMLGLDAGMVSARSAPQDPSGAAGRCPVMGAQAGPNRNTAAGAMSTQDWWPNQLNLKILYQNPAKGNPVGPATTPRSSRGLISRP